jgi:2-dehydro-3-deoxyphosphooctonate aldolase (KDO 8-P synthase)
MLTHYDNVVFDVTHAVQKPGGNGTSSGGNREYVPGLARAASALGVQNFFVEVHTDPDHAPSDGPNMLKIEDFEAVVEQVVRYNYKR